MKTSGGSLLYLKVNISLSVLFGTALGGAARVVIHVIYIWYGIIPKRIEAYSSVYDVYIIYFNVQGYSII